MFASGASAALVCYVEDCLPLASSFYVDGQGRLGARLGGRWSLKGSSRAIYFDGSAGREDSSTPRRHQKARFPCPADVTRKNYAQITDSAWQTANMPVCADTPAFIYVGLGFYDGEGIAGQGGLLRIDKHSHHVEQRTLPLLDRVSVNSIVAKDAEVWFGTTTYQECSGTPFVHGLIHYNWETGDLQTYEGSDDGPIGFVIHDLRLDQRGLWVATDLGLSLLDQQTHRWRHWLPEEKNGRIEATEMPAEAILMHLAGTIPSNCLRSELFANQLIEGLQRFRPALLRSHQNLMRSRH
jgi:hypothetical protein